MYALATTEMTEIAPSFVVDITRTWARKLAAIAAFESQFSAPPGGDAVALPFDRFRQNVEIQARRQGQKIGVELGEAFVLREPLQVDDLQSLTGPSI